MDKAFKPNILTYTAVSMCLSFFGLSFDKKPTILIFSILHWRNQPLLQVIHAIARSRMDPGRAERIVNRIENQFDETGDKDIQPDCVCYDALIN